MGNSGRTVGIILIIVGFVLFLGCAGVAVTSSLSVSPSVDGAIATFPWASTTA